MSVLACCRRGCENVMCDRLSSQYGYLCNSCFEELVSRGVNTDVEEFLETAPLPASNQEASRAYFNILFPVQER